jgi:hypothetical protein
LLSGRCSGAWGADLSRLGELRGADRAHEVRAHHRDIERVAAVSDSDFLRIAPAIARHFLQSKIRVFPSNQEAEALAWLQTDT